MNDVQNSPDYRGLHIDQVGVSDLRYPIEVLDRANDRQKTVATLSMSVNLPHHFKGTHMSRFVEVLNEHHCEFTGRMIPKILHALKKKLDAESARIEVEFPYFLERSAPVSGVKGMMSYQCCFTGESGTEGEDFILSVKVPITSLCPCSKEISDYGAHNQRGYVTIKVRTINDTTGIPPIIWIEELIDIAEASASAPVFAVLKRSDEKHLTELAYNNPVFVEDVVRNVAVILKADERVAWFSICAENQESIHNHNAFARIEWRRE